MNEFTLTADFGMTASDNGFIQYGIHPGDTIMFNQHGGGIWNKGMLTITQCMIHGNTAPWEPDDIANDYQGRLALMDNHQELVDLYESCLLYTSDAADEL